MVIVEEEEGEEGAMKMMAVATVEVGEAVPAAEEGEPNKAIMTIAVVVDSKEASEGHLHIKAEAAEAVFMTVEVEAGEAGAIMMAGVVDNEIPGKAGAMRTVEEELEAPVDKDGTTTIGEDVSNDLGRSLSFKFIFRRYGASFAGGGQRSNSWVRPEREEERLPPDITALVELPAHSKVCLYEIGMFPSVLPLTLLSILFAETLGDMH